MEQPYTEIGDGNTPGKCAGLRSKCCCGRKCIIRCCLCTGCFVLLDVAFLFLFFSLEVKCALPKLEQESVSGKQLRVPTARALLVQTACSSGDRLARQPDMQFVQDFTFEGQSVEVNFSKTGQKVIGFGGALTQASSSIFKDLRPELQQKFLDLYYGDEGIGYTLGRIPINSCDFAPASYSFDEASGDADLKHFDTNVTHDLAYHIPFIKTVSQAVEAHGGKMRLLASPWSPPAWMKTNGVVGGIQIGILGGLQSWQSYLSRLYALTRIFYIPNPSLWFGKPSGAPQETNQTVKERSDTIWDAFLRNIKYGLGSLKEEYRDTWAKYISKWVAAYEAQGVDVWAMTVQNEPSNNPSWEGCGWTADAATDFLGDFLGPTMQKEHPDLKIFAYDDQTKTRLPMWANTTYAHPTASKYLYGFAFHWYGDSDFHNIEYVHKEFPQAALLPSEATFESTYWNLLASMKLGIWRFGEGYAKDILGDLNAGTGGWLDWNVLLNDHGGPNHVGNNCDSPVVTPLKGPQELFIHPQYYFIGHFSKYILPDSIHLDVQVVGRQPSFSRSLGDTLRAAYYSYGYCAEQDGLQATGFLRPDGIVALVVLNCFPIDTEFKLLLSGGTKPALKAAIPAHAIQTYLFNHDAALQTFV